MPAPTGAGDPNKTRLESSVTHINPHCMYMVNDAGLSTAAIEEVAGACEPGCSDAFEAQIETNNCGAAGGADESDDGDGDTVLIAVVSRRLG